MRTSILLVTEPSFPLLRFTVISAPTIRRAAVAAVAALSLLATSCAPEAYVPDVARPAANPGADADTALDAARPLERPATPLVRPTPEATPAPMPTRSATSTPAPEPMTSPTPAAEPTEPAPEPTQQEVGAEVQPAASEVPEAEATAPPILQQGDDSDQVRELQHRLMQLNWFSGRITGTYADQTRLAVEGFQVKRGLPGTGAVDQATWDRLLEMTRTPTHDEMHNVLKPGPALFASGSTGDAVKDLQARLKQLKWYSELIDGEFGPQTVAAVEGFQAKREIPVTGEVDQRTLDRLTSMSRKPTTDELNNVVAAAAPKEEALTLDDRCLQGRVVCISKKQRKLAWVIDGKVHMTMDVRFGSELTPTREGTFSVGWKSRNHVSKLYGSPMPYALFFSGGQAVHYSADFAARGYNGSSHGCVNVRDKEAVAALFDAVREGDKVVVYVG